MYCFIIITCFLGLSTANFDDITNEVINYYNNLTSIKNMRIVWDDHREAMEHSLAYAMQETIGKKGLNVYKMKNTVLRLTRSYYQEQGPVGIILNDLDLTALPQCWLPDVSLSLSSNVLKIETILTKMIISAQYLLLRNKSNIIENVVSQDPFKTSPFLFKQVQDIGYVTFLVEGCILSGYIIARLKGGKVVLGYDNLNLKKCEYSVEIYKKGKGDPPVLARFADQNAGNNLDLNHYLLMTIREEFITKIQAALFSVVNTTAIFGENESAYEKEQEDIFLKTSSKINKVIRDRNERVLDINEGTIKIPDYFITFENDLNELNSVHLSNIKLTGLDTAYNSFTGGPFKLDDSMVGEQIRFTKLLVRGHVSQAPGVENDELDEFAVEISDFAINMEINMNEGIFNNVKTEVVGYRNIELPLKPDEPLQTLITGYLKNEVPKVVIGNIMDYMIKPENLKLLTYKDGVAGSLTMTETGSETDEANFVRLNEYVDNYKD